ncbi:hypothetical protein BGW80DRAFT_446408 [Lactifluus volemus]|nr:hypothetical protein BGW80DRAFT_446408 [Lactifluus volemus]
MGSHKRTPKHTGIGDPQSSSRSSSTDITHCSPSGTSSIQIYAPSEIHKTGRRMVCHRKGSSVVRGRGHISPCVKIEALPDNVLLDIFEFCLWDLFPDLDRERGWTSLGHVCRRWRFIVFGSPLRLDLCLLCTDRTPVKERLGVWPPLPIVIFTRGNSCDNIVAVLEHPNRIRQIWFRGTRLSLDPFVAMMQEQSPALKSLHLAIHDQTSGTMPALPNTFLGGSAPRLQSLFLDHIPFPTLPKLLLSCNGLVDLSLLRTPHSGYISPEAMAACITALPSLESLDIGFESPASRPDPRSRRPPPLTRAVLVALTSFKFCGVSEYLEDLVAQIDAPRVGYIGIILFSQLDLDTRQIPRFISHASMFMSPSEVFMYFSPKGQIVMQFSTMGGRTEGEFLSLRTLCIGLDWQVSFVEQICSQFSFLLSGVKMLEIEGVYDDVESTWQTDMDHTQWLELFRPFTAVQTLRISRWLQPLIVSALQGVGEEMLTEVLPALDNLYLGEYELFGSGPHDIEPFIVARRLSDHPVTVHHGQWERDF